MENASKSLCYQSINHICKIIVTPRSSDLKQGRTTKYFHRNCPFELELVISQNNQKLCLTQRIKNLPCKIGFGA